MHQNSVLNLEKMPQKCMECFRPLLEHLAWIDHQFLSGIRDSMKAGSLWGMMRGVEGSKAQIGKYESYEFCKRNLTNRNDKYLFSHTKKILHSSTMNSKEVKKTYRLNYPDIVNAELAYIHMKKTCTNSSLNCEEYSCFKLLYSDLRIVPAKMAYYSAEIRTKHLKPHIMTGSR